MSDRPETKLADEDSSVPGPDGTLISEAEHARLHRQAIFCAGGPEITTVPFVEFLDAGHELIHWIGQHIKMAQRLDQTIEMVAGPDHGLISYSRSARRYGPLWDRIIVEKVVDYFLVYIARLLTLIFTTKPETLRSGAQVRVDDVLKHSTMDELIRALADERVSALAYKGMRELVTDINRQVGLKLFHDESQLDMAIEAIEIRNILVHNNGVVNSVMARKIPQYSGKIGQTVEIAKPLEIATFLAHSAADLDGRAMTKFDLVATSNPRRGKGCNVYLTAPAK